MNKKINFAIVLILVFSITLFNFQLTSAQELTWNWCEVSAYGTDLVESQPPVGGFTFIAVAPPSGSNIPNTVLVINEVTNENYTMDLQPGDELQVNLMDFEITRYNFTQTENSNNYIIFYQGEAGPVRINRQLIPEFSTILIVPLSVAITLLAILYRKKRSK